MMVPRRNGFDIFDEVFNEPFFTKKENKLMKTDVREKDGNYVLDIDLPGYNKEDIKIDLTDGYLTVTAKREEHKEENEHHGNYIHKERFFGECSRSYYAGENVKEEDIKASFRNGTLEITFPIEDVKKLDEGKKYIEIRCDRNAPGLHCA